MPLTFLKSILLNSRCFINISDATWLLETCKPTNQIETTLHSVFTSFVCNKHQMVRKPAVVVPTASYYNIPERVTIYPPSVQLCCTQRSGHLEKCPTSNTDEDLDALLDSADGHIWCLWLSTHHVCSVIIGITVEVKARMRPRLKKSITVQSGLRSFDLWHGLWGFHSIETFFKCFIFSATISLCVFL